MTTKIEAVQVTMSKEEFLTLEAALGVLICMVKGEVAEAFVGTAITVSHNGQEPLMALTEKVLRLHMSVFPNEELNSDIKETLEKLDGLGEGGCTCGKCS